MKYSKPVRQSGTLCLTFDNMGAAREVGLGQRIDQDPAEWSVARGYPRVLDLLDALGLTATFFIEGWNAVHNRELVMDIARRGHEIGLHGWVHEPFHQLDRPEAGAFSFNPSTPYARSVWSQSGFERPVDSGAPTRRI